LLEHVFGTRNRIAYSTEK